MTQEATYTINDKIIAIKYEGNASYGKDEVLFLNDDNLLNESSFKNDGFKIAKFLTYSERLQIFNIIEELIYLQLELVGINKPNKFSLVNYHKFVNEESHYNISKFFIKKGLPLEMLPFPIERLNDCVSEVCNTKLEVRSFMEQPYGERICSIRIIRPLCGDENPPHKDTWSSTGLGTINIYVPIAGSDENSSLSLIPGSHFWNESDIKKINPGDAIISNKKYSVGGAVESKFGLNMIRPNPASDEFLIFTPHLLHGGAKNFNINHTRFSIEMRFQRAGKLRKFIV